MIKKIADRIYYPFLYAFKTKHKKTLDQGSFSCTILSIPKCTPILHINLHIFFYEK